MRILFQTLSYLLWTKGDARSNTVLCCSFSPVGATKFHSWGSFHESKHLVTDRPSLGSSRWRRRMLTRRLIYCPSSDRGVSFLNCCASFLSVAPPAGQANPSLTHRLSEVDGDQVCLRRRGMRRLHGHGITLPTSHQDHRVSFEDKMREKIWSDLGME